jgi:antitoxin (DNA-binding transcriptional repressor) of toxin-antitoxin stability system
MLKQTVNISSFQKNLPDFIDLVLNGDELILTKSDIPIAKIIPFEEEKREIRTDFFALNSAVKERKSKSEAPENWFG